MIGRLTRFPAAASVAAGAAALLVGLASPAHAVGTGGVDLSPAHGSRIDVALKAGQVAHEQVVVRNLLGRPATVEVYAASATRSTDGSFAVGAAGSAAWIGLEDTQLTLKPKEVRTLDVTIDRNAAPYGEGVTYGALVVEQQAGMVVSRAAKMVYLNRIGPGGTKQSPPTPKPRKQVAPSTPGLVAVHGATPFPWWLVALAASAIVAVSAGLALAGRRRRGPPAPDPAPTAPVPAPVSVQRQEPKGEPAPEPVSIGAPAGAPAETTAGRSAGEDAWDRLRRGPRGR